MTYLILCVTWFVQLYLINSLPWLGVVWPMFVVVVIILRRRIGIYQLSWLLVLLGVLADISSHQPAGIVTRSYIVLIVGVWALHLLDTKLPNKQNYMTWLAVLLVSGLSCVSYATSWPVFVSLSTHELVVTLIMATLMYGSVWLVRSRVVHG